MHLSWRIPCFIMPKEKQQSQWEVADFYRPNTEFDLTMINKSSVWVYDNYGFYANHIHRLSLKKKINILCNHIMLRLHNPLQKLKSWWATQIYKAKERMRLITNIHLLIHCIITLPPSPIVSQAALPWPLLCCKTCCSSSLPAGCFPPSTWARLSKAARFVPHLSLQWGARCLKKLLQPCMCRTPMWPMRTSDFICPNDPQ